MAGLLSNLGGIDPNLFNKPTMGQLKSKQQPPAAPAKAASHPGNQQQQSPLNRQVGQLSATGQLQHDHALSCTSAPSNAV